MTPAARPQIHLRGQQQRPRCGVDEIQYGFGDGPCLTAAREHRLVHVLEEIQREVLVASKALRLAFRQARAQDRQTDVNAAMNSPTTIDLAVGIIMGQNRYSQDEAFNILKNAYSTRNVNLRDLAAGIVADIGKGPATTHFDG